jgi:hypothetical protein
MDNFAILGLQVTQTAFWAVVPAAATLLGSLAAGWILYRRGQRTQKPRYAIETLALIGKVASELDQLQIQFAGKQIPQLSLTKVAIWNSGRATIRAEDVASADQVEIVLPGEAEILQARVHWASDEVNCFGLEVAANLKRVRVRFEYVDHGQGAVIHVLHSGPPTRLELHGTIKGAGHFRLTSGRSRAGLYVVLAPLAMLAYGFAGMVVMWATFGGTGIWWRILGTVALGGLAAFAAFSAVSNSRDRRDAIPRSVAKHMD